MLQLKRFSRNIVIAGTLIIWFVKFIVRPFELYTDWMQPFIGVAPNLIGSFLIPFGAYFLFRKYFSLQTNQELRTACWFGLLLVIINEYLQLIPAFGRTFDLLDIISSFAGVYIGYRMFDRLMYIYLFRSSETSVL